MNVQGPAPRAASRPKPPTRSHSSPSSQPPSRSQANRARPDQGPSAARVAQARDEGRADRSEHVKALRDTFNEESCQQDSRLRVATGSTPRDCDAERKEQGRLQAEEALRPVVPPPPELTAAERKAILERESARNAPVWTPVEPEAAGRQAYEECRIGAELNGRPYNHCGDAAEAARQRVQNPLPPGEST